MKLYELTQNYLNLMELLDNPEIPKEMIEAALAEVAESIEAKSENLAKVIKTIDLEAAALKDEEKRINERRKMLENRVVSLKEYLFGQLKAVNINKVKTPLFTVSIQNNPLSVEVIDEDLIPEEYFVIKREVTKKAILDAIKQGIEIPGAATKQTEGLRIR